MSIQVNLSIKEIYDLACPECRKALEKLVKDKLENTMVKQILQGKEERP